MFDKIIFFTYRTKQVNVQKQIINAFIENLYTVLSFVLLNSVLF